MKVLADNLPARRPGYVVQGGPQGFFVRNGRVPVDPKRRTQLKVRAAFGYSVKWVHELPFAQFGWFRYAYQPDFGAAAAGVYSYLSEVYLYDELPTDLSVGLPLDTPPLDFAEVSTGGFELSVDTGGSRWGLAVAVRISAQRTNVLDPVGEFTPWFGYRFNGDELVNLDYLWSHYTLETLTAGKWLTIEAQFWSGEDHGATQTLDRQVGA